MLLYGSVRLAFDTPVEVRGPAISLSPGALPWYALLSVGRMLAAYALSMLFTLAYGYLAAYNRRAEQVLMPLLDMLQSVPILSFLPAVLLRRNLRRSRHSGPQGDFCHSHSAAADFPLAACDAAGSG